ncbi:MAG: Txe/YoeB family addiction module toxin [Bacteroidales bacterium]|nr:Txe/YoeB family addiction module toxin [Bacteroidales bacterium]
MSYILDFADRAQEDLLSIRKAGNRATIKKAAKIIDNLEANPYIGEGKPERLKGYFDRVIYSRRLNHSDRVLYEISEEDKTVRIFQFLNHYGDK